MARPRIPNAKAQVSGAALHDPQRFRNRTSPQNTKPIGDPYPSMTDAQRAVWLELRGELPWLHSAHRPLLRLACLWAAKLDDNEFGVAATQALSSLLSKLGATPVDESRITHPSDDDEDDTERFFRAH